MKLVSHSLLLFAGVTCLSHMLPQILAERPDTHFIVNLLLRYMGAREPKLAVQETFGYIPLYRMTTNVFREFQYGFDPTLAGTYAAPASIWMKFFFDVSSNNQACQETLRTANHFNTFLLRVPWNAAVTSCDEVKYPRCSWHHFVNLVDPVGTDYNLLNTLVTPPEQPSNSPTTLTKEICAAGASKIPMTPYLYAGRACYPLQSLEQASVLYTHTVCSVYGRKLEKESSFHICPNPCARDVCRRIDNAISLTCNRLGIYKNDFGCQCKSGYKWDQNSRSCLSHNHCNLCNPAGTQDCRVDDIRGSMHCICHPAYAGYLCDQEMNACIFKSKHAHDQTGLVACNVAVGKNKCIPQKGMDYFSCKCEYPYAADRNKPYDNCLIRQSVCDAIICVYGTCVSTKDGRRGYCHCQHGFKGQYCDEVRGQWQNWQQWTQCYPPCGIGFKTRMRNCTGHISDCFGESDNTVTCPGQEECLYSMSPERRIWDDFWNFSLIIMLVFVCVCGAVLLLVTISSMVQRGKYGKTDLKKADTHEMKKHQWRGFWADATTAFGMSDDGRRLKHMFKKGTWFSEITSNLYATIEERQHAKSAMTDDGKDKSDKDDKSASLKS